MAIEINSIEEEEIMTKSLVLTCTRKELYDEVWSVSVAGLSRKYNIPYTQLLKQIKELNFAFPPSGYWTKLSNGKPVTKTELSGNTDEVIKLYRTEINKRSLTKEIGSIESEKEPLESTPHSDLSAVDKIIVSEHPDILGFLDENLRNKIISAANNVTLTELDKRFCSEITAHNKKVIEWQKQLKENESKGWGKRNLPQAPLLADTVSAESLPRVYRIIDTLLIAMRPLGCSINASFQFVINNEVVSFNITEAKDEVKHILTKEENYKMLQYQDDVKIHSYAYKPNIRKYDHPYNGKLTFIINGSKKIRDCVSYKIEDKLGETLICFFEASEVVKEARLAAEGRKRKEDEEKRLREQRRELYNIEAEKTLALVNSADDYAIACKIRAYIDAVKSTEKSDEETVLWIQWAERKADWFDPTVAVEDDYLGKRKHEQDENHKKLDKKYYSWDW